MKTKYYEEKGLKKETKTKEKQPSKIKAFIDMILNWF
jgi:hypothetical protein